MTKLSRLKKWVFLQDFWQFEQLKHWKRCLRVCILAQEGRVIAVIAKASSRCFHGLPAAMLVSLRGAPTWRLHTELYKCA